MGRPSRPTLQACCGDAKTLRAFDLPNGATKNLAGVTVRCEPKGLPGFYLLSELRFATPGDHAQDACWPAHCALNAPPHKFRWSHAPGSFQPGTTTFSGA